MNTNRIMIFGSMFFTFVLIGFGVLKYSTGYTKTGIYYLIGGLGFFIVYLSYKKRERKG